MKNIIFDLDGTLLDTSKDIVKAVNSTLAYFKFAKANKDKIFTAPEMVHVSLFSAC